MGLFKKKQPTLPEKFRSKNGIVLSRNYTMETDKKKKGTYHNDVLMIGPSEADKVNGFVIPNILQKNASYIINDRGGKLHERTAEELKAANYDVIQITLQDIPDYLYIFNNTTRVEEVELYIKTINQNSPKTEKFWNDMEEKLLSAITWCFLLQNRGTAWGFKKMLDMVNMFYSPIDEKTTKLDVFIAQIAEMHPNEAGAELTKLYEPFKTLHQSNKKIVVDSLKEKLSPFATNNAPKTLDLSQEKTAIYVTYDADQENVALLLSVFYLSVIQQLYSIDNPFTEIIWDNFADIGIIERLDMRIIKALSNNVAFLVTADSLNSVTKQFIKDYVTEAFETIIFVGIHDPNTIEFIRVSAGYIVQKAWTTKDIQKLMDGKALILMQGAGVFADEKF